MDESHLSVSFHSSVFLETRSQNRNFNNLKKIDIVDKGFIRRTAVVSVCSRHVLWFVITHIVFPVCPFLVQLAQTSTDMHVNCNTAGSHYRSKMQWFCVTLLLSKATVVRLTV